MTVYSHPLRSLVALTLLAASPGTARAAPPPGTPTLRVEDAIRAAWERNPALAASAEAALAARADAARARDARLPTLSLSVRAARTDEPMMAFGTRLDQARIGQADFAPDRLNHPSAVGAVGAGVSLTLPLYMGGRLVAGQRAAAAMADAETADDRRRRTEVAAAVVEAYFAVQAAGEGSRYADDLLAHARETERFVRERNAQGLMLDADVARAVAFRAQAEAERALAAQRLASARSALALLTGADVEPAALATPLADPLPALNADAGGSDALAERSDLQAARLRREAARDGARAVRGGLLPLVVAQASAEALRTPDLDRGGHWTAVGVVARWDLALADVDATRAASARARAAEDAAAWREREAAREVAEARSAATAADARIRAAEEAVAASLSVRTLRDARHRQGLLPLTDVLDAEAGLAGARALLLASRLEARVARARLALSLGLPIEGTTP